MESVRAVDSLPNLGSECPSIQPDQGSRKGLMIFSYEGIRLRESCWIDGKPYFTHRAIAEFLEYPDPEKDPIGRIIRRNPYIKQFAALVKFAIVDEYPKERHSPANLSGESSTRTREIEIEVFDPIGFQLIIFESHQPKAKQYKIAVAHLVYDYATGNLKPFKWSGDIASALSQIISMHFGSKRK